MHTIPRVCIKAYFNSEQNNITRGVVKQKREGWHKVQFRQRAQTESKLQEIMELAPKTNRPLILKK